MAIHIHQNHEIGDDFVDALRSTYIQGKLDEMSVCDQSETAISYALKETSEVENIQFVRHLRSCPDCLALVFDVRLSLEEASGQIKKSAKLDMDLSAASAISEASDTVHPPSSRPRSMGARFISYFLSPKLIAGLATCSIIFFIMIHYPAEKNSTEDIERIRKKITSLDSPQKPTTQIYKLKVNPDDSRKLNSSAKPGKKMKSSPLSPLEITELKYFKLMGVMLSDSGNIAIVKDRYGKEYIVAKGSRIGNNSGRVIRILGQKIIVEEQHRDKKGDLIKVRKELVLPGERKP